MSSVSASSTCNGRRTASMIRNAAAPARISQNGAIATRRWYRSVDVVDVRRGVRVEQRLIEHTAAVRENRAANERNDSYIPNLVGLDDHTEPAARAVSVLIGVDVVCAGRNTQKYKETISVRCGLKSSVRPNEA